MLFAWGTHSIYFAAGRQHVCLRHRGALRREEVKSRGGQKRRGVEGCGVRRGVWNWGVETCSAFISARLPAAERQHGSRAASRAALGTAFRVRMLTACHAAPAAPAQARRRLAARRPRRGSFPPPPPRRRPLARRQPPFPSPAARTTYATSFAAPWLFFCASSGPNCRMRGARGARFPATRRQLHPPACRRCSTRRSNATMGARPFSFQLHTQSYVFNDLRHQLALCAKTLYRLHSRLVASLVSPFQGERRQAGGGSDGVANMIRHFPTRAVRALRPQG